MTVRADDILLFAIGPDLPVIALTKSWEANWNLILHGCRPDFVRVVEDILGIHCIRMSGAMVRERS